MLGSCSTEPLPGAGPPEVGPPVAQRGDAFSSNAAPDPEATGDPAQVVRLVVIKASWCPTCRQIAPVVEAAVAHYARPVDLVVLDVSDQEAVTRSRTEAEAHGVGDVFSAWDGATPTIAVVGPSGRWGGVHGRLGDERTYAAALDAAASW